MHTKYDTMQQSTNLLNCLFIYSILLDISVGTALFILISYIFYGCVQYILHCIFKSLCLSRLFGARFPRVALEESGS